MMFLKSVNFEIWVIWMIYAGEESPNYMKTTDW